MKRFLKYFVMVFILLLPFVVRADEFTNVDISDEGILTFSYDNDDISYVYAEYRDITRNNYSAKTETIKLEDGEGSLDFSNYEVDNSCPNENDCPEKSAFIIRLKTFDTEYNLLAEYEVGIGKDDDEYYFLDTVDITFKLNGGTMNDVPEVLTIYKGVKIHLGSWLNNAYPTKEGYYFDGFFADSDYENEINTASYNIFNEDTTLYALWTDINKEVTIKFETNGGTKIEDIVAKIYSKFEFPKDPTKDGYVFVGWYYDKEFLDMISVKDFMAYRDLTIYAKWAKKENVIDTIKVYIKQPLIGDKIDKIERQSEHYTYFIQSKEPEAYVFDDRLVAGFGEYFVESVGGDNSGRDIFYGTFEKDVTYIAGVNVSFKEGFDRKNLDVVYNPKVIVNDENVNDTYCYSYISYADDNYVTDCYISYKIKATDNKYGIMDGKDQTIDGKSSLVVRADGDIKKFKELKVDNKVVDSKNYELTEGSTIVNLKTSYLDSLNNGVHKLTFVYEDGEVDTTFTLNSTKVKNPLTVDNIILVLLLIFVSSIVIVSLKNKRKLRYEI